MSSQNLSLGVVPVSVSQPDLWIVAVIFFGVGDLVTTSVGLRLNGVVELSPILTQVTGRAVYAAMVGLKLAVFGACYLLWTVLPKPHCVGAPLGLAVLGIVVTVWNITVLTSVLLL